MTAPDTEKKRRVTDLTVGVFVLAGVAVTFLVLFLVGQESRLWERTFDLRAQFSNVGGLKVGGAVRLAGINIGIVSRVDLPPIDPTADARVVAAVDVGDLKLGEGKTGDAVQAGTISLVRGRCSNVPGCLLLPIAEKSFPSPRPLSVLAKDIDEKLEAVVEVRGKNLHGVDAVERILVRVRSGREGVAVGKVLFSSIERVALVVLKDNEVVSTSDDTDAERRERRPTLQVGDGSSRKLNVVMRVSERFGERIRTDSQASVVGDGLLGDKYIDITIGSVSKPQVKDGDLLLANDAVDFAAALADTGEIIDNVNAATESIRAVLEGFREAGGEATVVAAMQSIQDIAVEIQRGDGLIHQLIFDPKAGKAYQDIVGNVKESSVTLNASLTKVDTVLKDVRTNTSLVHELLYGEQGQQAVTDARKLINEASTVVADVRTQPGFVHNLIYEKDRGEILANANAASEDIKQTVADVRAMVADAKRGKGTVGALLVDPSVYEDLKLLLGNVRRNDALKSLIRYAIEQEDKKSSAPARTGK